MNHIFYLHSNICSIIAYDIIKQLPVEDKVVVIANRGCSFFAFKDRIVYYDATKMFEGYCNHLDSLLKKDTYKSLKLYKKYLTDVKKWLKKIIGGNEFILYTPNYAVDMCRILGRMKYCQKYYYIEEGTMSYMSIDSIKKLNYNFKTRIGNVARFFLLGTRTCFQLNINAKFAGTIALSNDAFVWNKNRERKLVDGKEYLRLKSKGMTFYDYIIIISYGSYEIDETLSAIEVAIKDILKVHQSQSIAIKLHPQSYFYYPDYTHKLEKRIQERFGKSIAILSVTYPVEAAIVLNHTSIYSIFVRSSLSLYSLVLNKKETYLINPDLSLMAIPSLENYIAGTNK